MDQTKKDLLLRTHEILRDCGPLTADPLLQAGYCDIKRDLLNYFRKDLDFPLHSAKSIVKLVVCMLRYISEWPDEEFNPMMVPYERLAELGDIWSTQLKG